jgi:hypothetical protein
MLRVLLGRGLELRSFRRFDFVSFVREGWRFFLYLTGFKKADSVRLDQCKLNQHCMQTTYNRTSPVLNPLQMPHVCEHFDLGEPFIYHQTPTI